MRIIGNDPSTPRQAQIVASGTLPSGQPVVVNSDGTVSAAASSGSPAIVGAQSVFETGNIEWAGGTYDSNSNKIVFVYKDDANSDYGTAVVGTVSGTDITFGTPVIYSSINTDSSTATFDSNSNKVVVSYYKNNVDNSYNIVGTVSGTSISFGAEDLFSGTAGVANIGTTFDSSNNKVIIAFPDPANSYYGTVLIGTVSGTSITTGSEVVFQTARVQYPKCAFDTSSNKVIISYFLDSNSVQYAVVGTVSGTSISFGTPVATGITAANGKGAIVYDSTNNKTVIATRTSSNGGRGEAVVGTVSGTSISFGTPVEFTDFAIEGGRQGVSGAFNSDLGQVVLFIDGDGSGGKVFTGTVSGTSISFDSGLAITTGASDINEIAGCFYDAAAEKIVVGYGDASNSSRGTANVVQPDSFSTNLTSENYIGMSGGVAFQTGSPASAGSPAVFVSGETRYQKAIFDSNSNKVIVAYRNDSSADRGFAVVGTVSGTSITFGTPVIFNGGSTNEIAITFDSNSNKVVIAYQDGGNSNSGTAIVGTVSGTSISFGSEFTFNGSTNDTAIAFDSSSNKVVVAYQDNTNSGYGTAKVGTVSGTSISFGTATVFQSSNMEWPSLAFDSSNNKMVIGCGSGTGKAYVGTVSGTSISFGSVVTFESGSGVQETSNVFDSNSDKIVIAYRDGANSGYGTAIVGTVSGTSISFGTKVVFDENDSDFMGATFDSNVNKVVIAYRDRGNSDYGTVISGTVSGTSIAFDDSLVYEQAASLYNSPTFDSDSNKVVIAYRDNGNSSYGTGVVITPDTLAITRGSVADGDNAAINLKGAVAENQVGLTAGQSYYVQTDGTLGTTPADPSVFAGTAVAATKLIVKG